MDSWWSLGEASGYSGGELGLHNITCPFCFEEGNFKLVFHAEKKKPNKAKKLNFDTYECGSCKGYVMVLWSADGFLGQIYDYKVLPWPLKIEKFPEHWPADIGRYWLEAKRGTLVSNWESAAVMARSALQMALRAKGATGGNFHQEIDSLTKIGVLPPLMNEWAKEVKALGNESAHPEPGQAPANPEDVRDIIQYLEFLLEYLYDLPHQIDKYRKRRSGRLSNSVEPGSTK